MAMSHSVTLPKEIRPRFPVRCVFSDEPHPDSSATIWTLGGGFLSWFSILFARPHRVTFPIMSRHKTRFFVCRYLSFAWFLAAVVVAVFLVMPYLETRGIEGKLPLMLGVLFVVSPFILVRVFVPPRFDITVAADNVEYEFASRLYADEFLSLNENAAVGHDLS